MRIRCQSGRSPGSNHGRDLMNLAAFIENSRIRTQSNGPRIPGPLRINAAYKAWRSFRALDADRLADIGISRREQMSVRLTDFL